MFEYLIMAILLMSFGGYFLYRNISFYRSEAKFIRYLETSSKAKLWVAKLGMDRTAYLTKKYFLPIGIVVALMLFAAGLANFVFLFLQD